MVKFDLARTDSFFSKLITNNINPELFMHIKKLAQMNLFQVFLIL